MKSKAETMKDLAKVRRRRITLQHKTREQNELGDPVERWEDWRAVWAERGSLWGRDYWAAAAVGAEQSVEFVVRYTAFLEALTTTQHRIMFDGQTYDIKQIDRLQDDGQWLKIRALGRDV